MGTPLLHSKSSARRFGGQPKDYIEIHKFIDCTKHHLPNFKHRCILHNSLGMDLAERVFGDAIVNSDGKDVEVRAIVYDHIMEDMGRVPTVQDWLENLQVQPWMMKGNASDRMKKEISIDLETIKQ